MNFCSEFVFIKNGFGTSFFKGEGRKTGLKKNGSRMDLRMKKRNLR